MRASHELACTARLSTAGSSLHVRRHSPRETRRSKGDCCIGWFRATELLLARLERGLSGRMQPPSNTQFSPARKPLRASCGVRCGTRLVRAGDRGSEQRIERPWFVETASGAATEGGRASDVSLWILRRGFKNDGRFRASSCGSLPALQSGRVYGAASGAGKGGAVSDLEPDGGNLYREHRLMVHSGRFWRCAHGSTGFKEGLIWKGCQECAEADPKAFAEWSKCEQTNTKGDA